MERGNGNDDDDDDDDDDVIDKQFNLCDYAANQNRWDIVQLAIDFGCTFSDDTQLLLLRRLSSILEAL